MKEIILWILFIMFMFAIKNGVKITVNDKEFKIKIITISDEIKKEGKNETK